MKFLLVDPYYLKFQKSFYLENPGLEDASYQEQHQRIMDEAFGVADFYSTNLRRLGHEAVEVIPNCKPLQYRWAQENGLSFQQKFCKRPLWKFSYPWIEDDWLYPTLLAQIENYKPDVIHFQDPGGTSPQFLRLIRPHVGCITAQIACPIPRGADFRGYDIILSSLPNYVRDFQANGIRSAYFRLGFEASLIQRIGKANEKDVTFIGGFSKDHQQRILFFEKLADNIPLSWWGYGVENLSRRSTLRSRYQGNAWGRKMYEIIGGSKICLNFHIGIAANYANNMRLYEVTGMGSLLITDQKDNLGDLFHPGSEVLSYRGVEDCAELVNYYLANESERDKIAKAGQQRTLAEHTYFKRMQEFISLVSGL